MPIALHVIAKRAGAKTLGLERIADSSSGEWRSGCWVQLGIEPAEFISGYLYLHSTSNEASYFGGKIVGVEQCDRHKIDAKYAIRYGAAFLFVPSMNAKNIVWRGRKPLGAPHGGAVAADLAHET